MLNDLRYAARILVKDRRFSVIAILALALGIGANTALFSVVNGVLLTPLPFADADRIIRLYDSNPRLDVPFFSVSPPNYADWRAQSRVIQSMAAYERQQDVSAVIGGRAMPAIAARVSGELFAVLGVKPASGRALSGSDEGSSRAVIGDALWRRLYGARSNVIGEPIAIDGTLFTIVGIMPREFGIPGNDAEIWTPFRHDWADAPRNAHSLRVVARIRPDVTDAQIRADLEAVGIRLEREHPDTNSGWRINIRRLPDLIVGPDVRQGLWVLFGAVGFVLLIACANIASLLIAKGMARRREVAVRLALGASRWRIVRQLVVETILLAAAGGCAGLLLAAWGVDLLRAANPDALPRLGAVHVDRTVLAFTACVSLFAGISVGLLPSLHGTRAGLVPALRDGGRGHSADAGRQRLRSGLVSIELALSLVLLLGAGLLIKSFWRLQQVDPGFTYDHTITARLALPVTRYPDAERVAAFYERLLDRVGSLPDVRHVAAINMAPLSSGNTANTFAILGRPPRAIGEKDAADFRIVSGNYFETLGIRLVRGRTLTDRDGARAQPVAVIDATMAQQFWPSGDPVGQQIVPGEGTPRLIVGIVGSVANGGLDREPRPTMYFPYEQAPEFARSMTVIMSSAKPGNSAESIAAQVGALDADLAPTAVRFLDDIVDDTFAGRRFNLILLLTFAGVATVLAAIGVYGVTAYAVGQRTHELGIRLALGAEPRDLVALIVRQGTVLVAIGLAVGLAGGLALTRLLSTLLFDLSPTDPSTFVAVSAGMGVLGLMACYLPARQAMRIDPIIALRSE